MLNIQGINKPLFAGSGDVLQSRKEIAASPMPNLELHYTEWSASYTPADPIHDSYHEISVNTQYDIELAVLPHLCSPIQYFPNDLRTGMNAYGEWEET